MTRVFFTVTEHVRGVVDGRVVVRRRGARIPIELAEKLGLVDPPVKPTPRRPPKATAPAKTKRSASSSTPAPSSAPAPPAKRRRASSRKPAGDA